ncbi:MAG: hypothetical protein M1828_005781 [Chrysothrix sp. TS-e1954]|nr:MAG: hypothetical protein M1828_005781 [Chrysothrix sp. TS-e1954]
MEDLILFNVEEHSQYLAQFVDIHIACIEQDKLVAQFLPPLNRSKLEQHWATHAQHTKSGAKKIIMQFAPAADGTKELAGFVMLARDPTETGQYRGDIRYLLVSPSHRRKGIAARLMTRLEEIAKAEACTKLILGTEQGSTAEMVYPRLNYTKLCVIPDYCVSPVDNKEINQTLFFKDLDKVPVLGRTCVSEA